MNLGAKSKSVSRYLNELVKAKGRLHHGRNQKIPITMRETETSLKPKIFNNWILVWFLPLFLLAGSSAAMTQNLQRRQAEAQQQTREQQEEKIREEYERRLQRSRSITESLNAVIRGIRDQFLARRLREEVQEQNEKIERNLRAIRDEGVQPCHECDGFGYQDCQTCERGFVDCGMPLCDNGDVRCGACNGTGRFVNITCSLCYGKGKTACMTCGGSGQTLCDKCFGTTRVRCSSCYGNGRE